MEGTIRTTNSLVYSMTCEQKQTKLKTIHIGAFMNPKILSFQKNRSLAIVQLATSEQNTFDYISSSNAFKQDIIEVKEVNEAGSVNNIFVLNLSDKFIFFSDGDVVEGAKQNRVLNTSVLLPPKSKTNIPVSCIEQGRWKYQGDKFKETDYTIPTGLRASKADNIKSSLKMNKKHYAEQSKVWEDVKLYAKSQKVFSKTSNLSDVYEQKRDDINEFINKFKHSSESNGIAVFIKSKLLSIDIFNRTDIFEEYFQKLLKGSAVEAFYLNEPDTTFEQKDAENKTLNFFNKINEVEFEIYPGVGVGEEKRFNLNELNGLELVYESKMIHLNALNISKNNPHSY